MPTWQEPPQRRASHAGRLARGCGGDPGRLARRGRARRGGAGRSGGSLRTSWARTALRGRAKASPDRSRPRPIRPAPFCRTSSPHRATRKGASGFCARREPNWSRSSCSTTRPRRARGPRQTPISTSEESGVRTRLWRLGGEAVELDVPFLIADGHHRYETAVAFREEEPSATHTFAVARLVAVTRRRDLPDPPARAGSRRRAGRGPTAGWEHDSLAMYRDGSYFRLDSRTTSTPARCSATSPKGSPTPLMRTGRSRSSTRATPSAPS